MLKDLIKTSKLYIANCRKIMIVYVQSIVLYRSELQWDKQKGREQKLQKMHNKIQRYITGAWRTILVGVIAKKDEPNENQTNPKQQIKKSS